MRAALLLSVSFLLLAGSSAFAEDWVALWQHEDVFFGVLESGDVYRYLPETGVTELAGSLGPGPWTSFGKFFEQLLALRPDGQVWFYNAASGETGLYQTLPPDREWCSLEQHPENVTIHAITCDGEIWSLYGTPEMRADFGPCAPGERWICIATADDSYVATLESGDAYQGTWEGCFSAGTYGPGPWVGFARTYGLHGEDLALKPNGEIWTHAWWGDPELYLALPADRVWCNFQISSIWYTEPGYALTCSGEIWTVASPPEMVGAFVLPTGVASRSLGGVKAAWR